jgi:hypothetical protein
MFATPLLHRITIPELHAFANPRLHRFQTSENREFPVPEKHVSRTFVKLNVSRVTGFPEFPNKHGLCLQFVRTRMSHISLITGGGAQLIIIGSTGSGGPSLQEQKLKVVWAFATYAVQPGHAGETGIVVDNKTDVAVC